MLERSVSAVESELNERGSQCQAVAANRLATRCLVHLSLAVVVWLGAICPAPTPGQSTQALTNRPAPISYMRIGQPDSNTVQLELAMKRFVPMGQTGPVVWLVGVTHIGESNYFATVQKHLDSQGLVLFEGVRESPDAPVSGPEAAPQVDSHALQLTLAESLGLAFQLKAINYRRPHFRNSDLSWPELQRLMTEGLKDTEARQNAAQLALVMELLDSSSLLGSVVNFAVRLLGTSPKLQALARLALIEATGRLEGDLAQAPGVPAELQRLMQVLIHARNSAVLKDLQAELRKKPPPASVAILYGAGHMPDLEARLKTELNYREVETRWLPAITVRPAEAGVTAAEAAFVRGLVKWQMDQLQKEHKDRAAPAR
jgi:hypothetical protein